MKIFKELKKLGYIHYSATTIEELDDLPLNSAERISEQALVLRWFREKYNLFCEIQIDRTTAPKFCFNIFQYEHFGNYEEIRIGEWYLYRTQEEAEIECLKELIEIVKRK